jgi:hypothetical protein
MRISDRVWEQIALLWLLVSLARMAAVWYDSKAVVVGRGACKRIQKRSPETSPAMTTPAPRRR